MDNWIHINEQSPDKYQEVIICSDEDRVKSAMYLGNGKWSTYLTVEYWQPFPEAPKRENVTTETEAPKKRGRKKKA